MTSYYFTRTHTKILFTYTLPSSSSSSGAELSSIAQSFGLLNDRFSFPSILYADDPVFNLHLRNILFDVIRPSVLGSSL
jgi:hypothetical protein